MAAEEHFLTNLPNKIASDISQFFNFVYELVQSIIIWIFSHPGVIMPQSTVMVSALQSLAPASRGCPQLLIAPATAPTR
jgi:hypothetical protein